jgi:hypothetical protein
MKNTKTREKPYINLNLSREYTNTKIYQTYLNPFSKAICFCDLKPVSITARSLFTTIISGIDIVCAKLMKGTTPVIVLWCSSSAGIVFLRLDVCSLDMSKELARLTPVTWDIVVRFLVGFC